MVRYLSQYKGTYEIFAVSRCKETTEVLLSQNLKVGEFSDDGLAILPNNIFIPILETEKEKMSVFNEYDVLEINEKGIIYRWYSDAEGDAGIATTSLCNSNCIMCPASENERQHKSNFTLEQIDVVLKHLPKDLWNFTITGGEPTLIGEDDFIHVLNSVKTELPYTKILLLTNGRTLGDKEFFSRFILEKPKHIRVAIPIHGSTAEKHDYITQAKGSFDQTLRAIVNLLKANVEVEIRIVVSKLNCDDITEIANLIATKFPTVAVVNFVGLEMRGNCVVNAGEVLISYQEAFNSSKAGVKLLVHNGINVGLYNFPYCMIDKGFWPIAQKSISAYKSMFYDECEKCSLREECCGIFLATMNYYKPKVFPIVDGECI